MEKENVDLREYLLTIKAINKHQAQESIDREAEGKVRADAILQRSLSEEGKYNDGSQGSKEGHHRSKQTSANDDNDDEDDTDDTHEKEHDEVGNAARKRKRNK